MRALIDNCVPQNNGDAALIFTLSKLLKNNNYAVEFVALDAVKAKKLYPKEVWHGSFLNSKSIYLYKMKGLFRQIWKLYMIVKFKYSKNEYKSADIIISAPGGYIHSYYGIEHRLFILYLCKKYLKKKVGIYSQSIGDLTLKDIKIMKKYASTLDFIYVRDMASYKRMKSMGEFPNVTLTKDAALNFHELTSIKNNCNKNIAVSVRSWNKEGRSTEKFESMMGDIIEFLLKQEFNITFISTCQGVEGYVDDSEYAKELLTNLDLIDNKNIKVDDSYYHVDELYSKIKEFDFVIGTRFHMCLLTLLQGIPALNISYEEKGKEAYGYLGLADFTIDYNETKEKSLIVLQKFLQLNEYDKKTIFDKIKIIQNEQKSYLENII